MMRDSEDTPRDTAAVDTESPAPSSAANSPDPEIRQTTITKQLIAVIILCIFVLALFRFGAIPLVLTALFAFLDAWHAGIRKKPGVTSFFNISPAGWAAAILLLFIVGYPLYAFKRQSLKTTSGRLALFVLTNVFGIAALAMISLGILVLYASTLQ